MPLRDDEHVYRSRPAAFKNAAPWRNLKSNRFRRIVARILERSELLKTVPDDDLKRESAQLRTEVANGRPLEEIIAPAFALVRETAFRTLGMRHYPVQLEGGLALHFQCIVQMATGEGKTLVATCPGYLNALTDRGVHVVTVNDYLARRDAEEMGKIYSFLGLTVGVITSDQSPDERARAYRASITYATNKELGFDFLRDQIRHRDAPWYEFGKKIDGLRIQRVQRPDFHFAIVDEVDSVLIDEARTPLIIAEAPAADDEVVDEFLTADKAAREMIEDVDFSFERATRRVEWLRQGEQRLTRLLGGRRSVRGHRIDWHESCLRAIKAHVLFHRDVDYVVDNDDIVIVDESTGRKMPGRQWEEGLHQAVAAKEGITIKGQTETLARTTYQILFNRYEKVSGMSGTVLTDRRELAEVYGRGAIEIPTHRPCIRVHYPDRVFGSERAKWMAVVARVGEMLAQHRAVLVGTRSIEKSEVLSALLTEAGIEHIVLNARFEAEEAAIVSKAGIPGRVTVATNMAGRGTDIKLDPRLVEAGGLHVLGTERHESRRIDLQLIGRAARQGDPGSGEFFVSVEDPLIKRYRPRFSNYLSHRYGSQNEPIEGRWIHWFFRRVQLSIERQHRGVRNQLLHYDRRRIEYNRMLGTQ